MSRSPSPPTDEDDFADDDFQVNEVSTESNAPKAALAQIVLDLLKDLQTEPTDYGPRNVFQNIIPRVVSAINGAFGLFDLSKCVAKEDLEEWTKELKRCGAVFPLYTTPVKQHDICSLKSKKPPPIMYREMGAGKSSLINAVLDVDILPTSGMRACTASVTEITYHKNPTIDAQVSFISREQWASELNELKSAFQDRVEARNDVQSSHDGLDFESGLPQRTRVLWDKVQSVHPGLEEDDLLCCSVDQILDKSPDIAKILNSGNQTISAQDSEEFNMLISPYLASEEANGEFAVWPLVKKVKIFLQAKCLDNGATLVDLPGETSCRFFIQLFDINSEQGLGDANFARTNVTQEYLKKAGHIFVVAPIQRAVSSQLGKELLGRSFKTQLACMSLFALIWAGLILSLSLVDGSYNGHSMTFIATKSDDIQPIELMREIKGLNDSPIQKDVKELEKRCNESKKILQDAKNEVKRAETLSKEFTETTAKNPLKRQLAITDTTTCFVKRPKIEHNEPSIHFDYEPEYSSPSSEAKADQNLLNARTGLETAQQQLALLEDSHSLIEKELKTAYQERKVIFSQKRSEVSCQQIQEDFRKGIPENIRLLIPESDADLCVLPCSPSDYLRLRGQHGGDDPACFFEPKQTGIPAIQERIAEVTRERCTREAKSLLEKVQLFVTGIRMHLKGVEGITLEERHAIRSQLAQLLTPSQDSGKPSIEMHLKNKFKELALASKESLEKRFQDGLEAKAEEGAKLASQSAMSCYDKLADRRQVHWQTFRAVMRHDGEFGRHDLNRDLVDPFSQNIVSSWTETFSAITFSDIKKQVRCELNEILSHLVESSPPTTTRLVRKQAEHCRSQVRTEMQSIFVSLEDKIKSRRREISGLIAPEIQSQLEEGYEETKKITGKGCVQLQKETFRGYLEKEKEQMFDDIVSGLKGNLTGLANDVGGMLELNLVPLARKIEASLRVLWEIPDTRGINDLEKKNLIHIMEQVLASIRLQKAQLCEQEERNKPSKQGERDFANSVAEGSSILAADHLKEHRPTV
ncbi:hypothetical protein K435DRAFT_870269 [Dendrothele bispora CBS 962.96]|uniref:Uncharacterized protein n=1 Tax=Dendrothele bispora (strain CBS 962.96) TaxID=1314807 RepID=A0A4S8L6Y2_DENBC|nr:hypothetical protein K435DRAFT_870269 [Dendrothele bispora CBS 962.96]